MHRPFLKHTFKIPKYLLVEMTKRDVPGFAIGGLSGGEEKDDFWRMVTLSTDHLPREKPRYLMGVGYGRYRLVVFLHVYLSKKLHQIYRR